MQEGQNAPEGTPNGQVGFQPVITSAPITQEVPQDPPEAAAISWTASEFIAHAKSAGWYLILAVVALAITAGVFFLTKDKFTTAIVLVMIILFGAVAARKPRELAYALTSNGIKVGSKFYTYATFKSYSVLQEGGIESVWFMPMQRFMPGLTIYFSPQDGERIISILSEFLPFEPRETDLVDQLMHRLRF